MIILGIETSCDETGIAIYDGNRRTLLSNALYSQVELHAEYGGVVPELASRDHIGRLIPLVKEVLSESHLKLSDVSAIAYTAMPGLVGALMVGAAFAKSLAFMLEIKAIAIHHLEGHLLSILLGENNPKYPYIALIVSGGHTQLVQVDAFSKYKLLGESIDDAAGEAFDKVAKMLDLPYPGGAYLANLAKHGKSGKFSFPRPMCNQPGLDFSFSGLKTSVLYEWINQSHKTHELKSDIAYGFQEALVETLTIKCSRALEKTRLNNLVVVGGVSANICLRESLKNLAKRNKFNVFYPPLEYCTDNGAMIAIAGAHHLSHGNYDANNEIHVRSRASL
jgi:N6-L-threonylcarbamoyladenine synthase